MTIVISLGGSLIVPHHVDYVYLKKLGKFLSKYSYKEKIVVVTGGGYTAREYFKELKGAKLNQTSISLIGVAVTKLNARVVASIFKVKHKIPETIKEVKSLLKHSNLVICGALGYKKNMTSDGNAADLAAKLKARLFINLTNVKGVYDKAPKKYEDATFIPHMHYSQLEHMIKKIKYKPGQHFVLDQVASSIIHKFRIRTIIAGPNIENLKKCLYYNCCTGTIIA